MWISWGNESIDDWRPPTRKHIPKCEWPRLTRIAAHRDNNALLLLNWQTAPLSDRQRAAQSHKIFTASTAVKLPGISLSSMETNLVLSKLESLHKVEVKPKQRYQPRWCSCGGCEEEPREKANMFQLICKYLDWVDLSILTLVSKSMAQKTISELACLKKHDVEDEQPIMQKLRLMTCLEDWMPEHFKFCHHCLLYLPLACFDDMADRACVTECMDCLFRAQSKASLTCRMSTTFSCEGCYLVDAVNQELGLEPEGDAFECQGTLFSEEDDLWCTLEPCNTSSIALRTRRQMVRLLKRHKDASVFQCYWALLVNHNLYPEASVQVEGQLRIADGSRGAHH